MLRTLTKHFWIVNLLFIAAAAWLIVQISVAMIHDRLTALPQTLPASAGKTVPVEKAEPYERYSPIPERNIFNPSERGLKLLPLKEATAISASPGKGGAGGAGPAGAGPLRLIGTVTGPAPHSFAVIQEGADRKQKVYHLYDDLGGGKIARISRDRILIRRDGEDVVLTFAGEEVKSQPPPGPSGGTPAASKEVVQKLSPNRFLVNREDVSASVNNVNQFMTQARFRPNFVEGRPMGFAVSEVVSGSLMEKLGLRNNDVVKKVNGQMINKPEDVMQAYSQLLRDNNIELEVERGGRSEVLRYEIR